MGPFRHILVPTDFSAPSDAAVEVALAIAMRFDARVTLLHVMQMPPYYYSVYAEGLAFPLEELETKGRKMLDAALARAQGRYAATEKMFAAGRPWEAILEAVARTGADLVVMGTHGRRGISHAVLGSVAEKVLRHSPVPVLTTPAAPAAA